MDENEKKLRDDLAKRLGMEFCTEEEVIEELDRVRTESHLGARKLKEMERLKTNEVSVKEILQRCNDAQQEMGKGNPHRFLLFLCATCISQLLHQLNILEAELAKFRQVH